MSVARLVAGHGERRSRIARVPSIFGHTELFHVVVTYENGGSGARIMSASMCTDFVYLQARMDVRAECKLVILCATPEGKNELVGFYVGVRESAQSWSELLINIKVHGLTVSPEVAVRNGAMGF